MSLRSCAVVQHPLKLVEKSLRRPKRRLCQHCRASFDLAPESWRRTKQYMDELMARAISFDGETPESLPAKTEGMLSSFSTEEASWLLRIVASLMMTDYSAATYLKSEPKPHTGWSEEQEAQVVLYIAAALYSKSELLRKVLPGFLWALFGAGAPDPQLAVPEPNTPSGRLRGQYLVHTMLHLDELADRLVLLRQGLSEDLDMKEMLSCLPNALTTPAAETEIVPRLNKVYDIFGNEGRVWDLVRRTRLVLAHCHNIRYEFKTRGSSCADVDVLEGILSVVEIFTSIMPEGFDVWPFVQELAQIYDIFNTSEEDLRTTLERLAMEPI